MPKGKTTTSICPKCGNAVSLFAFNRHLKWHDKPKVIKPKVERVAWNKGKTALSDVRCFRPKTGPGTGTAHTQETKSFLSKIAKDRGVGGYQPLAGRSKKFKVNDSYGNEVTLQSTYELRCSSLLNELNIKWIRPKSLKYNNKRYFADFYLTEYDLYLDPKNDYKAILDTEKIQLAAKQNSVKIIILLDKDINVEYIKSLCS